MAEVSALRASDDTLTVGGGTDNGAVVVGAVVDAGAEVCTGGMAAKMVRAVVGTEAKEPEVAMISDIRLLELRERRV